MYTLMNKDRKLLDFKIQGTGNMEYCDPVKQYEAFPFWINDINQWLTNRGAAKHRQHINDILEKCGGKTPSGFIRLTHCLSLNDTLWVKNDREHLKWADVSLYTRPFNEIISKLSFDGNGLYGEQMSTTSPELTTEGSFDKCWVREGETVILMKAGSAGADNAGMEPYSEVLASAVYESLCNGVKYTLGRYRGKTVSRCELFTDEAWGFKPASVCGMSGTPLPLLLKEYAKYGDEDLFRRMIAADAVTVNPDRHYGNFGFLICNDTFEKIKMAPVFDYNLAMAPYADWREGFLDMDGWIRKRGPVFGGSYYEAAKSMMTPGIRSELVHLKDLELEIPTDQKFTKERLEIMNRFKNIQIDRLLGGRRQFGFGDIRQKYEMSGNELFHCKEIKK
ncbi:MAG: hypothetical protein HFI21_04880 [Lachnospiraceae bacterium]|uniref:hypothetical protein n=1 Tax=Candidatus Merdisoma sp. JLR.KK011 TaxID=3114299 RepID=UPI0029DDD31B|nr:hypothetical protein [Lachnospiraceae bacterium]MCI9623097.1 hypothetical protein [Lachnospiraceae bacterium]